MTQPECRHRQPERCILMHGSYFANNFGDVFLWQIMREIIRAQRPDAKILHAGIPSSLTSIYNADGDLEFALNSSPISTVIFSGGGYLTPPEKSPIKWHLRNFLRHKKAINLARRAERIAFLGVGVGDLSYSPLGWLLRLLPSRAIHTAWMRDAESAVHFRRLFPNTQPAVIDDLVFAYLAALGGPQRIPHERERRLGLHVELAGLSDQPKAALFNAIDTLNRCFAGRVVLFTDCESASARATRDELHRRLVRKAETVIFAGDCEEFLSEIDRCDYIITTKLHVGICAAARQIPVLSIPAHPKTPRFYNKIGLGHAVTTSGAEGVDALLNFPDRHIPSSDIIRRAKLDYALIKNQISHILS